MGKTVFFNIPSTGHINPSLPLVRELVQRGEQVVYINTEAYRSMHEAAGARYIAYPKLEILDDLMAHAGGGSIPRNMAGLAYLGTQLMPFVAEVLESEQPDYVIHDSLASWAKMGAEARNLPTVAVISTFIVSMKNMPRLPMSMMASTAFDLMRYFPVYLHYAWQLRTKHHVKPIAMTSTVMSMGQRNIVYTSREFQPNSQAFDEKFSFVGPTLAKRLDDPDFPFDALNREPVVYISLGTINHENLKFYQDCFAAFGDHPGQFVLSVGKRTPIESLGTIPENFIVRNFVPQLNILERADLFITHGGMNSVQEGLWYGVPMIVIPQQIEQAMVAQQVVAHQAGIAVGNSVPFGQVESTDLRAALERILGAEYQTMKQNAGNLGETLCSAGGVVRAADEILAFVGG